MLKNCQKGFWVFFKIYIYNCSCGYCGFFWVDQKKIKSSFLGDIRGKKKKKVGEENSFPCLVLFISNGMKQSGLRACLDGGLWHWCSSCSVVKSVQVPNAAHSSKRSRRDAKPPCKVRGLHALQNPSLGKEMQLVCTGENLRNCFFFFFYLSKCPKVALPAQQSFWSIKVF